MQALGTQALRPKQPGQTARRAEAGPLPGLIPGRQLVRQDLRAEAPAAVFVLCLFQVGDAARQEWLLARDPGLKTNEKGQLDGEGIAVGGP